MLPTCQAWGGSSCLFQLLGLPTSLVFPGLFWHHPNLCLCHHVTTPCSCVFTCSCLISSVTTRGGLTDKQAMPGEDGQPALDVGLPEPHEALLQPCWIPAAPRRWGPVWGSRVG